MAAGVPLSTTYIPSLALSTSTDTCSHPTNTEAHQSSGSSSGSDAKDWETLLHPTTDTSKPTQCPNDAQHAPLIGMHTNEQWWVHCEPGNSLCTPNDGTLELQ